MWGRIIMLDIQKTMFAQIALACQFRPSSFLLHAAPMACHWIPSGMQMSFDPEFHMLLVGVLNAFFHFCYLYARKKIYDQRAINTTIYCNECTCLQLRLVVILTRRSSNSSCIIICPANCRDTFCTFKGEEKARGASVVVSGYLRYLCGISISLCKVRVNEGHSCGLIV